jgi:hypothetical protein
VRGFKHHKVDATAQCEAGGQHHLRDQSVRRRPAEALNTSFNVVSGHTLRVAGMHLPAIMATEVCVASYHKPHMWPATACAVLYAAHAAQLGKPARVHLTESARCKMCGLHRSPNAGAILDHMHQIRPLRLRTACLLG